MLFMFIMLMSMLTVLLLLVFIVFQILTMLLLMFIIIIVFILLLHVFIVLLLVFINYVDFVEVSPLSFIMLFSPFLWLLLPLPLHCPPNWNFLKIERLLLLMALGKTFTFQVCWFFPQNYVSFVLFFLY